MWDLDQKVVVVGDPDYRGCWLLYATRKHSTTPRHATPRHAPPRRATPRHARSRVKLLFGIAHTDTQYQPLLTAHSFEIKLCATVPLPHSSPVSLRACLPVSCLALTLLSLSARFCPPSFYSSTTKLSISPPTKPQSKWRL